jgi:hypothetical protein
VVVQNYSYSEPKPPSVSIQTYPPSTPQSGAQQSQETFYLIAFKDHRITAAVSYWVEGNTLHYVTRQHEQRQTPLDSVDRAFSEQLNRDRHVNFKLPQQ